jgi:hypothetical protein
MLSRAPPAATRIEGMSYPCPHCAALASAVTGCPACGRGPDADAIEVIRLDAEIRDLQVRLGQAWHLRQAAAARVRAAVSTPPQHAAVPGAAPEASSRVVQNVLFLLGGLLLAAAAVVFTAVAWAQFGVGGRALLLASITVAALAVPPVALRRGLTGTAETAAALGVLFTLLDGYAAWHVDLLGVAAGAAPAYAGVVCAVTAALAGGLAVITGLTGPRWAALVVAQPVLPLLLEPLHPGVAGWSLVFGAVAAADVVACRRIRPPALAAGAAGLAAVAVLAAGFPAAVLAGTALVARPVFHASWAETVPSVGWRLPAALALVAAALTVALPARRRPAAVLGGAAAVALTLPAALALPWWTAAPLDLLVVAAALTAAAGPPAPAAPSPPVLATGPASAARPPAPAAPSPAVLVAAAGPPAPAAPSPAVVVAGLLAVHAVGVGFGRPGVAALVLATLAVFGGVLGVVAGHPALRIGGLVAGVLAVPAAAWTGSVALGLDTRTAAFVVLAASAAAFVLAARLPADQARAVEAAAQPGALLAVLLTVGSAGHAAAICALWGLVLGARALRPAGQAGYLIAAAAAELGGWLLLLAAAQVALLEAYTIPAAAVLLLAGLRARPGRLSSRAAYGPALAAALVPSLASVLVADGQLLRRLLLGVAALAIVLAGARARLRAPVEIGGMVLVVLALRELAAVWDLVPRWIPLAGGGLLLVVLAATVERRRRDLTRFRQALARLD